MRKPLPEPHFDAPALLAAVHKQDHGLVISTNDTVGFRRIMYAHGRAMPQLRVHIYADPRSRSRFFLMKARAVSSPDLPELIEEPDAEEDQNDE